MPHNLLLRVLVTKRFTKSFEWEFEWTDTAEYFQANASTAESHAECISLSFLLLLRFRVFTVTHFHTIFDFIFDFIFVCLLRK